MKQSIKEANEARHKKFCKAFRPGTRVTLTGNPDKWHTISEVSSGRVYIKIEGLTGIFLRNHITSYTNKPVEITKCPKHHLGGGPCYCGRIK